MKKHNIVLEALPVPFSRKMLQTGNHNIIPSLNKVGLDRQKGFNEKNKS